jgi:hypothetical protein
MSDKIEMTKIAVMVELSNGKVYQVATTKSENLIISNMLQSLHDGAMKVLPEPLNITIG